MIRIEVRSNEVRTVSGVSKKNNKPYTIRDQEAYASTFDKQGQPHPYPERISIQLDDGQEPYQPGIYQLSPTSIFVGDFGRLMLGRPQLIPVKTAQTASKAA